MKNKVIKNQDDVLIDKVSIYNFDIEDIQDIDELKKKNLIIIENAPTRYIETNSGQQYQKIELEKCEHFDTFVCALSKCGKPYTKMELSENGKDGMRNLNCITVEELKAKIKDAEHYLSSDLGILCNFDFAKIKSIELNKTFDIALDSLSYDRVIKTLINLMPPTASKIKKPIISDSTTYSASNKHLCEILQFVQDKHLILNIGGSFIVDCSKGEIDPMTQGMIMMWGVFSEMERNIISQRVKSGLANAKAKGKKLGRPQTNINKIPDKFFKYYQLFKDEKIGISEMARLCNLSRPTIYNYIAVVENNPSEK